MVAPIEYKNLASQAIQSIIIDVDNKLFKVEYVNRSNGHYEYHCPEPYKIKKFIDKMIENDYSLGQAVYMLVKNGVIISKQHF